MSFQQTDFFDFEYASGIWEVAKTGDKFDQEWERVIPAYEEWEELNKTNKKAAEELMKADTKKGHLVRRGHDIEKVLTLWLVGYKSYRSGRVLMPWNYAGPHKPRECDKMKRVNIFTNSCEDYPDWRTEKNRKIDTRLIDETWPNYLKWQEHLAGVARKTMGSN